MARKFQNDYLTVTRPTCALLRCLLALLFTACTALGSSPQDDTAEWLGVVKVESAAVHSEMSEQSSVVRSLKKDDVVIINLEIESSGGIWCHVAEEIGAPSLGYIRGVYLLRELPASIGDWFYRPPPEEASADAKSEILAKPRPTARFNKDDAVGGVKKFFQSRFGRTLPVSAFGQTSLHARMGFDHRNGIDVALHPDSAEGRELLVYLRSQGIPFIAFRHAIRGSATGPHIHIGNPSPRNRP